MEVMKCAFSLSARLLPSASSKLLMSVELVYTPCERFSVTATNWIGSSGMFIEKAPSVASEAFRLVE